MVWPFGKRKTEPGATSATATAAKPDNAAIVDEVCLWLNEHALGVPCTRVTGDAVVHLGRAPTGVKLLEPAPAGAVLKMKKGKLGWVDLYDPRLRETINALVKHLDRQQKWYFNGVISTRYDEKATP